MRMRGEACAQDALPTEAEAARPRPGARPRESVPGSPSPSTSLCPPVPRRPTATDLCDPNGVSYAATLVTPESYHSFQGKIYTH